MMGDRRIRSAIDSIRDRRLNPRVKATATYFWRRWVSMSVPRRIVVTLVTATAVGGTTFAACQSAGITGPSESAGTIARHDSDGDGLLDGGLSIPLLESLRRDRSDSDANLDPDFVQSTETTFPTTEVVYNVCRNEAPVLNGYTRVKSRLVLDGLTMKYKLRSWTDTRGVYAEATVYEDDDHDPNTPPKARIVRYHNQTRYLDEFEVGPAGLPFESDQESRIWLRRDGDGDDKDGHDRDGDGYDRDGPIELGDDMFVYARQRVRVNENGMAREKSEFRTECK